MPPQRQPLRFLSGNRFKIAEAEAILGRIGVPVVPLNHKIYELQTQDTNRLVRDKTIKAFAHVGRPLFVEHTGLYLEHLNGFPGGLTESFWETLQADRFADLFGKDGLNTTAVAKTVIGYCDGRKILTFEGNASGRIVSLPRGPQGFQWDCVFQPDGETQTFAELGERKNDISMRKVALEAFVDHLNASEIRHAQ